MHELRRDQARDTGRASAGKIDAFGWGVFFIWIGVAFLLDVGWSVGILGVGLIALGVQAIRRYFSLPLEYFGLAMGCAMVAWGGWQLLGLHVGAVDLPGSFMPLVFIALGVALVLTVLFRRPPH